MGMFSNYFNAPGFTDVFPEWNCGGSEYEIQVGESNDKNGNPYVFFNCDCEEEDLGRYISVLESNGFSRDPVYSDKWFKAVGGKKYVVDITDAFASGGMCICLYTD
ncbi:MAG: hypothetical protein IKS11_04720 [Lachnospiraceae bacterium]|jgi:hypothetical protein|nr:hypothetical protein [Lachnospiraceae bacterium]